MQLAMQLDWNDTALISQFWQGLNTEVQKVLSYQRSLPVTFAEYAQECIFFDNQQRAQRAHDSRTFHQKLTEQKKPFQNQWKKHNNWNNKDRHGTPN